MESRPHKRPRIYSSSSGEDRPPKRPAYSEPTVRLQNGKQRDYADYTVAIVCALDFEMSAVRFMLDRQHRPLPEKEGDRNSYVLGELNGHNVVIACLPGTQGKSAAAHVAADLERTFPHVQDRLLVGIGGGVPSDRHDIRLGDVVLSMPDGQYNGVVQYDLGKDTEDGFSLKGSLLPPPRTLINAVALMKSDHYAKQNRIAEFITEMTEREPKLLNYYQRPSSDLDILFRSGFRDTLGRDTYTPSNQSETIQRNSRLPSGPHIHYGLVASGDRVLKSAHKRDSIRDRIGDILCFEMEACGLVTELPYMVIRGISDYADSHKNDQWQHYAAAVAAGCAKELLTYIHVHNTPVTVSLDSEEDVNASRHAVGGTIKFTEEQRHKLLESLEFDQFNARQKTIKLAHKRTCRWLLSRDEYKNWLDATKYKDHYGFLWIKGKPGTGKSTIMNFAHNEAKRKMKDKIVISFFFNARGADLEKSTMGMYRSLLLQLLQRFPKLQDVLLSCLETLGMKIGTTAEHLQFTINTLKYIFREAIHSLDRHSIVCFIDALDECSEEEVRDMISFFQEVDEYGENLDEDLHFQVCFSSRHYPHISIDRGLRLVLEGQEEHNQDIADYVIDKLKIGNSKAAQDIRDLLREKASGVFMWVVLVVDILNKEYDRGRIMGLRNRLQDIPSDLHELFRDILRRDSNDSDKDVLLLCIQWVLFARQPLTPEQFYFAMHSGVAPESLCEWDTVEITQDVIKRFILDSSKGLAETTRSKNPTVQFIHESVVDFLLKKNGFADIWNDIGTNFRGLSHERLKSCCINYINIDFSGYIQPNTEIPEASSKQAKSLRESVIGAFPLLKYALQNVFYHSDCAQVAGIPQGESLEEFCVPKWVLLDNVIGKHHIRRHAQNVSLLYLLAELNAPNLVEVHPLVMSYLEIEKERYGTPLFAALAMGNRAVVRAFLRAHAAQRPSSRHLSDLYDLYCQDDGTRSDFGRNFSFLKLKGILFHLVEFDHEIIFQFAMDIYPDMLGDNYYKDRSPLSWAVKHGCYNTIKLLIEAYEVNISTDNTPNRNGEIPLQYAEERGFGGLVELLLKNNFNANTVDPRDRTLVSYAAGYGHDALVKVLLENYEIDINLADRAGRIPLSYAAEKGYFAVVRLLIEKADVNIADIDGRTPLSYAAIYGNSDIVKLLLAKANPDLKDHQGRTPLSYAAENGYAYIVKLLLAKANPDLKDHQGRTPLSYAAIYDHSDIVELLLEKANADLEDTQGRTPLSYAAGIGYAYIVKLLLAKTNPDLKDHHGRTPLSYAAENGNAYIVKLLLEKANADLEDDLGQAPLSYAAGIGHAYIVKLLLEHVKVDSDNLKTTMSQAMAGGQFGVFMLLPRNSETAVKMLETPENASISYAARKRYDTMLKELFAEANTDDILQMSIDQRLLTIAAKLGDYSLLQLLLKERQVDVNGDNSGGRTALSAAVLHGHESIVKLLLERSEVNVNAEGSMGTSALPKAAPKGPENTVRLLLEKKEIDVNATDLDGRTALYSAVRNYNVPIVELLLATDGIDVNIPDNDGCTPFSFAAERGYKEIGRLLLLSTRVDPNIVQQYPDFTSTIRMHT
ncbi:uncharacterized protein BHQ10_002286 [Talaromyces amestolkiae]|uniref:Nephrocystin 3-like N-terminal domain-containing protein n=1 Tax=Talaromyces amestolkiae TaxID=1196081 RepID=A0A364KRU9_TALAM|nr:uncharacterized protein BHQ10_002286 [Talaromyces amestolkiae]RAO66274.1 hypothetical protein BHQ10_002286 [Talaromyces amestolkiae]